MEIRKLEQMFEVLRNRPKNVWWQLMLMMIIPFAL